MLLKIEKDDEVVHDSLTAGDESKADVLDLEAYHVPAVLRRVLKTSKIGEITQIKSHLRKKLFDHLDDPLFDHKKLKDFKDNITITFKLLDIDQKPHLYKTFIDERYERLIFITSIAKKFWERYLEQHNSNEE